MYPSLASIRGGGSGGAAGGGGGGGGGGAPPLSAYGSSNAAQAQAPALSSADASPWSGDSPSVLRVKIADDYRLDPLVRGLGARVGSGFVGRLYVS